MKISDDLKQKKAGVEQMEKSFYHNQQKKHPPKQKLLDLPQYSEINEKKAIEEEVFKLQRKTANKIEEIHFETDALLDRLNNSIVEVDALKGQIENLHVNIRKLSDQLKILRKNNSSQGIMAKIQVIRSQNEKMIQDLKRKGSISNDEQIFSIRKENLLIDIQLLKKQKQDLRNQMQIEQKEYASKLREQQTKYYQDRAKEIALTQEKDTYKVQLDEAKRPFNFSIQTQNIH